MLLHPGRGAEYCVDHVCLSAVCHYLGLRLYLKKHMSKFPCMLHMVMARSSSGGVAIRYVLPVLWMMPYLHAMARNIDDAKKANTQSDSPGGITELTLQRIHKLIH